MKTAVDLQREAAIISAIAREDVRTGQLEWARINQEISRNAYASARAGAFVEAFAARVRITVDE